MESRWLAKRRDKELKRVETSLKNLHLFEIEHMEWEEHDLEYLVTTLGLEDDDLCRMEVEDVELDCDWLEGKAGR